MCAKAQEGEHRHQRVREAELPVASYELKPGVCQGWTTLCDLVEVGSTFPSFRAGRFDLLDSARALHAILVPPIRFHLCLKRVMAPKQAANGSSRAPAAAVCLWLLRLHEPTCRRALRAGVFEIRFCHLF